jgi:hypothetical protein
VIDCNAFSRSGLTSIRIPPKVEFIGEGCFLDCRSLSEVIFETPSSLREIGRSAFEDSAVGSIEIPEKCNTLEGALIGVQSISVSNLNPFFVVDGEMVMTVEKKQLIHDFGSSPRFVAHELLFPNQLNY